MKTRALKTAARASLARKAVRSAPRATARAVVAPSAALAPTTALAVRKTARRAVRSGAARSGASTASITGMLGVLNRNPLATFAVLGTALYLLLRPKSAYAVEAGKTYRYETEIVPPLADDQAALRLGGKIADSGNDKITVSTKTAAYDVQRSTPATLEPGQVLTQFEGSNIIFKTASQVA